MAPWGDKYHGGLGALIITNLYAGGSAAYTNTLAFSSGTITPTANSLLIVNWGAQWDGTVSTFAPSDNFGDTGGGTWQAIGTTPPIGPYVYAGAWYRRIGTGPSAGHVTITGSAGTGEMRHALIVDQVTGENTTTPVPQAGVSASASYSTTGSVSLGGAPNSTSLIWSGAFAVSVESEAVTTSGFTALASIADANNDATIATSYKIGSGPTTVAWSGLNGGQTNYLFVLEVAAGVAGYTVTFNANGGTGSLTAEGPYSSPTALSLFSTGSMAYTGYVFTGWNTSAIGLGIAYADGASFPFTANTTLYAQWSLIFLTRTATDTAHATDAATGNLTHVVPSLVQSGNSGTTSTGSGAAATVFAANTTVGNTVLVCVQVGNATTDVTSITSSIGTFTKVCSFADATGPNDYEWWVCLSATGSAKTVTVTTTNGAPYTIMGMEWPPALGAADGGHATGTGTTPLLAITPPNTGSVIAATATMYNGGITAPGGAWTNIGGWTSYPTFSDVIAQVALSSSSVNATWTGTSGAWT